MMQELKKDAKELFEENWFFISVLLGGLIAAIVFVVTGLVSDDQVKVMSGALLFIVNMFCLLDVVKNHYHDKVILAYQKLVQSQDHVITTLKNRMDVVDEMLKNSQEIIVNYETLVSNLREQIKIHGEKNGYKGH